MTNEPTDRPTDADEADDTEGHNTKRMKVAPRDEADDTEGHGTKRYM